MLFEIQCQKCVELRLAHLVCARIQWNLFSCNQFYIDVLSLSLHSVLGWLLVSFFAKHINTIAWMRAMLTHMACENDEQKKTYKCSLVCMHSINSRKQQFMVQCAQISIVCWKLKSQTVWRIWCFVWYIPFRLFLYIFLNSPRLHACCCCCMSVCVCFRYFLFFSVCFFFSSRCRFEGFDAVSCSIMCGYVYNVIATSTLCTYKEQKFLVKKHLPLTTCIYLSQIRCVSFIVYHTHIWSFHSTLLPFACALTLWLSFRLRFLCSFHLRLQVYSFDFLRSSFWEMWEPHRLALIPYSTQELRLLSFCVYNTRKRTHTHRNACSRLNWNEFT